MKVVIKYLFFSFNKKYVEKTPINFVTRQDFVHHSLPLPYYNLGHFTLGPDL
jgi:hypothetical protein